MGLNSPPKNHKTRQFSRVAGFPGEFWLHRTLEKCLKTCLTEHLIRVEVRVLVVEHGKLQKMGQDLANLSFTEKGMGYFDLVTR